MREDVQRYEFLLSILYGYYVKTVLDCGCGTGLAAGLLFRRCGVKTIPSHLWGSFACDAFLKQCTLPNVVAG